MSQIQEQLLHHTLRALNDMLCDYMHHDEYKKAIWSDVNPTEEVAFLQEVLLLELIDQEMRWNFQLALRDMLDICFDYEQGKLSFSFLGNTKSTQENQLKLAINLAKMHSQKAKNMYWFVSGFMHSWRGYLSQ